MKINDIIKSAFFTLIISILCFVGFFFDKKDSLDAEKIYEVFIDGKSVGYLKNDKKLYDIINSKQQEIKNKYNVTTVYPPENFKIINTSSYDIVLSTPEQIYNKMADIGSFTIEGYIATYKKGEKQITINVLDKKVFDSAIHNFVLAFIAEEEYSNYMNNTQKEIETTGKVIKNMYFDEIINIKKGYISVNDTIFEDESSLTQYLLFGPNNKIEKYVVKEGDTIDSISEANKLNYKEFLVANPKYSSRDSLLTIGDNVNITLINPMLTFVYDVNEILDTEFDVDEEAEKYINYISLENEITNGEFNKNQELKKSITYLFDNCGIIVRNKNIKLWIEDLEKIISMCNDTQFKSPILNVFEIDFSDENQVNELLNNNTTNDDEEILFPLPSNDEQYKIVEKVKSSNIVLVQGPPGTGKSHTIANLLSHYISEGKKVIVTSEKAKALEVLREKIPSPIRSLSLSILTSTGVDKELEFSINNILKHQSDNIEIEKIKDSITSLTEKLRENNISKQEVNKKIIELMSNDTISYKEKLNEVMNFEYDDNVTLMDIAKWLEENRAYSIIPTSDNECYNYSNCREFFEKLDDICDDIKNNSFATSKIVPEYDKFKTNDIELYINENIRHKNHTVSNLELINSIKQSNLNDSNLRDLGELLSKLTNLYTYFDKEFIKSYTKYEAFMAKLTEITTEIKQNKEFIMLTEEKIFDY